MGKIPKMNERLPEIGLVYAALIWGSTFVIVKECLKKIDPVILVGYRFLLAAVLMAGFCVLTRRSLFKKTGQGLLLGIILWLLYLPQTIGLGITTVSNSGFITGLFVAFVPIFSWLLFRKMPSAAGIIATLISLVGLWTLTGGMTDINTGDLLTLFSAIAYAAHILLADKYIKGGADPFTLSFQQFLVVGMASLMAGAIWGLPFSIRSPITAGIIVFLALFPTLSAFVIQVMSQKVVAPMRVSLIFALEPVFAALFAWTVGGEKPILHRALGGLLIFLALLISGLPPKKLRLHKKSAPTSEAPG